MILCACTASMPRATPASSVTTAVIEAKRPSCTAGCVGHNEARWLLHARSVQPDHVWVAHACERAHLAAHGLGDGTQRRLARLAMVAASLLLDRDGQPLPPA